MAAHGMFPRESGLQASCLNLKGGSSNITETHTKSGSVNCGRGNRFPPHCPSFSPEISHYKSTAVRMNMNEMLHAKHLAGGLVTHSIEAQITVIVLLLSTKTIHAKSKSAFN